MHAYDYAVIRIVPRVERGEFVNAGVVLSCKTSGLLVARIEFDAARLRAWYPTLDIEAVDRHLAAFAAISAGGDGAGPIGKLPARERFHWLTAPRSTMIQTSPVHTGRCADPAVMVERLLDAMVRAPAAGASGTRPLDAG